MRLNELERDGDGYVNLKPIDATHPIYHFRPVAEIAGEHCDYLVDGLACDYPLSQLENTKWYDRPSEGMIRFFNESADIVAETHLLSEDVNAYNCADDIYAKDDWSKVS